jgi:hypothetical protein
MNKYIFILQEENGGSPFFIGQVEYRGLGDEDKAAEELQNHWEQWREDVPEPDADSEFVAWLINKPHWHESDIPVAIHTFNS